MHIVILRRFFSVYFSTITNCPDCLNPFLLKHKNSQLNFIAAIFCNIIVHLTFSKADFCSAKDRKEVKNRRKIRFLLATLVNKFRA